jgi:RNA polymerase sigma factor (TIGR02999 family)
MRADRRRCGEFTGATVGGGPEPIPALVNFADGPCRAFSSAQGSNSRGLDSILVVMSDVTRILTQIEQGDHQAADDLLPLVYQELRQLAAAKLSKEKPGQTIQATMLVHEAWLRLVGSDVEVHWNGRGHFFGAAAKAMQRILVENARRKKRLKAGGGYQRVELSEAAASIRTPAVDVLAIDEALEKLAKQDHRKAELVRLRFFAGLTLAEAARAMGISSSTADNDWAYAKAWLRLEISESE